MSEKIPPFGRGGARPGAGRPRKFGVDAGATKSVRIPENMIEGVMQYIDPAVQIPMFSHAAPAGFASPADDLVESSFTVKELVDFFMRRPASMFLVRISGLSMKNAGINDGSIVICDRSLTPVDGDVVLAAVDGEVTCKRLRLFSDRAVLQPENEDFAPLDVPSLSELMIWGVVTGNFNAHRSI